MKNKVIFLDIDGVLNTESWRNSTEEYFEKPISEEKMPLVKYIVDYTDSKIVLTSSYRQYWNEGAKQASEIGKYMNEIFAEYGVKIHSKTRWLPGNNRRLEIEAWIGEHDSQISNYVVIDDIDYGFDKKHFVKTSDETGIDEFAVEKAINILTGEGYAENDPTAYEKWRQVGMIIKDAIGETTFDIWFKNLKPTSYFPKNNTLFLTCNSFPRRIIEDSEQFSDVLDRAIKVVFGGKIEYQIEDEDVGEEDADLLAMSNKTDIPVRKKIVYDPYSVYPPEIRAFKIHEKLRKILMLHPELIFKSKNTHYEMLFRVLLIFMNAGELIGITDKIAVSRRNNCIEIFSRDCAEFLVDKAETEKLLFCNSHYDKYVIKNFDKKKRYLPAPLHIRSSVKGIGADEDFYANIDSFFTLFSLVNMAKNVRIESVKDGQYHCVKYEKGINSKGVEEGATNKKNGTYITYHAPDEDELTNDEICDILEKVSLLSGVKTSFFDPDKGDMISYNYKDVGDYLDRYLPSKHESFLSRVKGGGRDRYNASYYNAKVEVGFQLAQSKGFSKSFCNYSLLPEDNVFAEQVFEILAEKFNEWIEGKIVQRFSAEDIMRNCAIIISVKTDCDYEAWEPMRAEPVKARTMINDMIEDAFDNFLYWLGGRDHVELLNLVFDIFKNKDEATSNMLFSDGMK